MVAHTFSLILLAGAAAAQPARAPATASAVVEAERALASGDAAKALDLAAGVKQGPGAARARIVAARAHIARDELDLAYEQLRRALDAEPRNVDALYYLGQVTARLSQHAFERLVQAAPDSARVHQLQAESLEAQEKNAAAEAEYDAALRAQPDLFDALMALARLKRIRLACDEAMPLYEKAEAIRPSLDTAFGLGACSNVLQQDEAAVGYFEKAVRRDPGAAGAWIALGASQNKIGRPAEAVVALQKAIAIDAGQGQAYYFLGLAYRALKDTARAQDAFKKAEALGGATGGAGRVTVPTVPRTP